MRYRVSTARSISLRRLSAAGVAAVLAIGVAAPAMAAGDLTHNKNCRKGVGTQMGTVAKKGMQSQEKCYYLAATAKVASDICTPPDSFPFAIIDGAAYMKAQATAETNLITKTPGAPLCPAATAPETLDNYPNNDTGEIYPNFDSLLQSSADYIVGTKDLDGDKVKVPCMKAIAAARRNIATKMLSVVVACQKTQDTLPATTLADFKGLSMSPDCLVETAAVTNVIKAQRKAIFNKCGKAPSHLIAGYPSGDAVGACSPLPTDVVNHTDVDCVSNAARALGRNLALREYPSETCKGTVTPAGRVVTVNLNSSVALGGADVRIDYPRFQAGVPKNGTELEVQDAITTPNFFTATDRDGALDVSLVFSPALTSGVAFSLAMDKCEKFTDGLCSVTTAAHCQQSKDCGSHCLEVADGGTAGNTNTPCQFDSDCPATGPVPGLIQQCVCPTCSQKRCVGPNTNPATNATCNFNTDCGKRCSNNPFGQTGATCLFNFQCGPGNTCDAKKACSQYARSTCTVDADCASPTLVVGACTALNSLHPGRNCTVANQSLDCAGHCSITTAQGCSANSQCPQTPVAETCVFGTCDITSPVSGLCNVGDPVNGGGFCEAVEQCNSQTDHCDTSQYLGCGKPGDSACPAGEDCTTQGALTSCTVVNALDEFANEVDGVTCSLNVTEP